jgi:hypothetical protein
MAKKEKPQTGIVIPEDAWAIAQATGEQANKDSFYLGRKVAQDVEDFLPRGVDRLVGAGEQSPESPDPLQPVRPANGRPLNPADPGRAKPSTVTNPGGTFAGAGTPGRPQKGVKE